MTGLVLFLAGALCGVGPDVVPIDDPVADPNHVLADFQRENLSNSLRELFAERKVQMAIVIVDSVDGRPIEDWSMQLATRWALGTAGNDDGILAVLAMADRLSRLEVGYGIEPYVPDVVAQQMLDDMRGYLRAGDVFGALDGLVDDVRAAVSEYAPGRPPPPPPLGTRGAVPFVLALLGIAGGIGVRAGHRRLAAVESKYRKRVKVDPGHAPLARRMTLFRKALPYVAWVGIPLALALVFRRGPGFFWAAAGLYLAWTLVGMVFEHTGRKSMVGLVMYAVVMTVALFMALDVDASESHLDGATLFGDAIPMWFLAMGIWLFGAFVVASWKSGGGSSSYSSSHSSGSTWSSSSHGSSSSSHTSSSSSSGGGYSGGGGRFGGGGASSSW